eukprot:11173498-Lingulodinium_polyedra.AAC.1
MDGGPRRGGGRPSPRGGGQMDGPLDQATESHQGGQVPAQARRPGNRPRPPRSGAHLRATPLPTATTPRAA